MVGIALASGALAAALLVTLGQRPARRGARAELLGAAPALRRGAMIGSAVGLIALLRVLDGLTPLTGAFVLGPFILAEMILSARRT